MSKRYLGTVFGAIGVLIALSGCLKIEATTSVLEDGQIIDRILLQPKMSMLASIGASYGAVADLSEQWDRKPYTKRRKSLSEIRADLDTITNACKLADVLLNKKAIVRQGIPYSTAPIPIEFDYSSIGGNGCSIQVGPYDPRKLPVVFAEDVMGMRVGPLTGLHGPYRVSTVGISLSEIEDLPNLNASCAAEERPELCREEMKIAIWVLRNIDEEGSGKLRNMLSNPGMLVGLAEITRSILKSLSLIWFIPDNAAVGMIHGPGEFTYGRGWRWRGNILEAIRALPEVSYEVRPRRLVVP